MRAGLLLLVAACSSSELPPGNVVVEAVPAPYLCRNAPSADATYLLEATIGVPYDIRSQGVEVAWRDRPLEVVASDVSAGSGAVILRREFATHDEALAFAGTFDVRVAGQVVGSGSPLVSACDDVATRAGLAPGELHVTRTSYWVEPGGSLTHYDGIECARSPRGALFGAVCDDDRKVLHYGVLGDGRVLTASFEGAALPMSAISGWSDSTLFYQLDVEFPPDAPIAIWGDLELFADGVSLGSIRADFTTCLGLVAPQDRLQLVYQDLELTFANGPLAIDGWAGVSCDLADGTGVSQVP